MSTKNKKSNSLAIWLFAGAVFVLTLPRIGDGRMLPIDLGISTGIGIILILLGFWALFRGN